MVHFHSPCEGQIAETTAPLPTHIVLLKNLNLLIASCRIIFSSHYLIPSPCFSSDAPFSCRLLRGYIGMYRAVTW